MSVAKEIKKLKSYFEQQPEVMLAFLFGSQAKGFSGRDSDFDVAVYLRQGQKQDKVSSDVRGLVKKEVNLELINNAHRDILQPNRKCTWTINNTIDEPTTTTCP